MPELKTATAPIRASGVEVLDRRAPGAPRGALPSLLEGPGWTLLRAGTDAILLALALAAATLLAPPWLADGDRVIVWLLAPAVLALLALRGMYSGRLQLAILDLLRHVLSATSFAAMSLVALTALIETSSQTTGLIARAWLFSTAFAGGGRLLLALTQRNARRMRLVAKPTLIVGAGEVGAQVERRLDEQPQLGLRPVGYLDANPLPGEAVPGRTAPVLGAPADLARAVEATGARHVVLAFLSERAADRSLFAIVRECEARGLEVSIVPRLFESVNVRVALEHLGGLPLYGLRWIDPKGWQFAIKHGFDRAAAALLLVALSPVLVTAALAVKLSSRGPLFFRQRRVGRDGVEFEMFKFRTMSGSLAEAGAANSAWASGSVDSGAPPSTGPPVERRTRVGRILRRRSIDELPQLLNVLAGHMSLVGPRPEVPAFVRLFEDNVYRYTDRHRVRSGVTGWAQVHGLRGDTSLADRVEWDNYYIANWSLTLDLKILLMTVAAVLRPAE